jgi:hypothetical protein
MRQASGESLMWWAFSSTSTDLQTVNDFLGKWKKRVIFTIDGGSSARDVRRYSSYVQEDELLLPCGCAFVVKTACELASGQLLVSLVQSDSGLLQGDLGSPDARLSALRVPAAAVRSATAHACVAHRHDFHQLIPHGLLAVVLSSCAKRCEGGAASTHMWRDALTTRIEEAGDVVELTIAQHELGVVSISASRCSTTRSPTYHTPLLLNLRFGQK